MCLIAFDWQPDSDRQLTLVANRDEFFARPSAALHRWDDHKNVIAGRDLQASGTWLGIDSNNRRFAALTNIRAPRYRKQFPGSRGSLVAEFLTSKIPIHEYAAKVFSTRENYGGFNLLLLEGRELLHLNSEHHVVSVTPGVHGLSNANIDDQWPKTESAKRKLQNWLDQEASILSLAELLNSREQADTELLPDTGIGLSMEQKLSSEFINFDGYGTRCSTALMVYQNKMEIAEISYDQAGHKSAECLFSLNEFSEKTVEE